MVKIQNFQKKSNKIKYLQYVITPKGIAERTKLTLNYMKKKMAEYDELKRIKKIRLISMWLIIKSEKKQIDFLKIGLGKRIGKDIKFYTPKIQIKTLKKKKIYAKEINLLGEYFFCFHKDFKDKNLLNSYKNIKGLKYILNGFQNSQTEISNFISKCKENENEKGFLKQTFFEFKLKKHYKFIQDLLLIKFSK